MTTRLGGADGIVMRGPNSTDPQFTLEKVARNTIVVPGVDEEITVDDCVLNVAASATIDFEAKMLALWNHPGIFDRIQYTSLTPEIASVDANGIVSRVSNGRATIRAKSRLFTKQLRFDIGRSVGVPSVDFVRFADGSLAKHCCDQIDSRLVVPGAELAMLSAGLRNPNCWTGDIDTTCISTYNSDYGSKKGGVLISPRHFLASIHYPIYDGTTVYFLTIDNVAVSRTISATLALDSASDLRVHRLDSDVPGSIKHAKVLPNNWRDYLPNASATSTGAYANTPLRFFFCIPGFGSNQRKTAAVRELREFGRDDLSVINLAYSQTPVSSPRTIFFDQAVGGDSGSPFFIVINDELVLINLWWSVGLGTSIVEWADDINMAMTTLGGGYQLEEVDLSGFTDYS